MYRYSYLLLLIPFMFAGCRKRTGDVLVQSDGSVIEGELVSISAGTVDFKSQSAAVQGAGRVWLLNGETFSGTVAFENGTVRAGTGEAPAESVMVIIWDNIAVQSESFAVDASQGWLDTGIPIDQGDMVSIRASGTVVTETGTSSPAGQNRFSSSVSLVPGATSGQLVFRTGEVGTPVAAGESWVGESPSAGSLMLAVNVPMSSGNEARGTYSVHVTTGCGGREQGGTAFYPASVRK